MKKIWKSIKNTVSYIWQLPQNILGAILCYIYCSDGDIYDWNKTTEVARASKQFGNINKYTKWFNSIPLLGVGAAAVYANDQE